MNIRDPQVVFPIPTGSDIKSGKSTCSEVLGLEPADTLLTEALLLLGRVGFENDQLADLAQIALVREC